VVPVQAEVTLYSAEEAMAANPKPKKIPVSAIRLSKRTGAETGSSKSNKPFTTDHYDIEEIEKELKLDRHSTLEDVLKSIFKMDGTVVITFPKTPRCKVCA